jgi:hypothetical protein
MKFVLILVMLLIFGSASAENVIAGKYNVSFDYNRPHEIISNNTTDIFIMKTFDGYITIYINQNDTFSPKKAEYELLYVDGNIGKLYYDSGNGFVFINDEGLPITITGNIPFYGASDFLRSFHIEKRTA